MFEQKTVFVVGAGGSFELGLPVGDTLKSQIAKKVDIRFKDGYSQSSGDKQITEALKTIVRHVGNADINPYCQAGREIASAMPQSISIDNFLHAHSDDENIVTMGKLGIAASILEAEKRSSIYVDQHSAVNFGGVKDTWHRTFVKILLENVQRKDLSKIFENVSFITFNYDRCIEHYLVHALSNYLRMPLDQAYELTNLLTIIHPYGQVGRLPWQTGKSPPHAFGAEPDDRTILSVYPHIRTFTERVEDDKLIEKMRQMIFDAAHVVYLGFSFGRMNMEMMEVLDAGVRKEVIATTLGISKSNGQHVDRMIRTSLSSATDKVDSISLEAITCDDLMKSYSLWLSS